MTNTIIALGLAGMSLIAASTIVAPVNAAQQFACTGRKTNGWSYDAQFLNGRFTQITWNRSGQPSQVSPLTFYRNNAQGQPIYRGSFQGATAISLVDLGQGNVRPGSQISVGVDEWGWSRGTCAIASAGGGSTDWFADLQLTMVGNEQWREAMRIQGFVFSKTIEHTNANIVERWTRPSDRATVDVVLVNNRVTDMRRVS